MPAARGTKRAASKTASSASTSAPKNKKKRGVTLLEIPLARRKKGSVFTCGQGDVGQLELGENVIETKFKQVTALGDNIVAVSAGGMHTIALDSTGKVWTYGCNDEGALGRNTSSDTDEGTPKQVTLPSEAVVVTAGGSHSAALLENGYVYAWGSFRDSHGSMGLVMQGGKGKSTKEPIKVDIGETVVDIASGGDHLVILSKSGSVFTMGCGEQGQLGRLPQRSATREARRGFSALLVPSKVTLKAGASRVWAGYHATFVLDASQEKVFAFGLNNYGQLGVTGEKRKIALYSPTECDAFRRSSNWQQVAAGQHHSLALNQAGQVFAVGRCEYGRTGLGEKAGDAETLEPIPTLQDKKCVSIAAGTSSSFAVTDTGVVYGWGMGSEGQLGTGKCEDSPLPVPATLSVIDSHTPAYVAAGGQHTILLMKVNGDEKKATPMDVDQAEGNKPASEEYKGTAELLHLSDEVLLYIFRNCSAQDLKALGYSCARLGTLVLDRALWVNVDASSAPLGMQRVRWLLTRALGPHTKRLRLKGYAEEDFDGCLGFTNRSLPDNTPGIVPQEKERYLFVEGPLVYRLTQSLPRFGNGAPSAAPCKCVGPRLTLTDTSLLALRKRCPLLTTLELEYCVIDCPTTHFPVTLQKLSLKGTKCFNHSIFLYRIVHHLPELEELDVSYCSWIEPFDIVRLSKMPKLRSLAMRECHELAEFVGFGEQATRYGFKTLEHLDLRGSPVGNKEVGLILSRLPNLTSLLLSPAPATSRPTDHVHYAQDFLPADKELEEWEEMEPYYFKPPSISEEKWTRDEEDVRWNRSRYYTNCDDPTSCIVLERTIAELVKPEEYFQLYHEFLAGDNTHVPLTNPDLYRESYQFIERRTHGLPPAGFSLLSRRKAEVDDEVDPLLFDQCVEPVDLFPYDAGTLVVDSAIQTEIERHGRRTIIGRSHKSKRSRDQSRSDPTPGTSKSANASGSNKKPSRDRRDDRRIFQFRPIVIENIMPARGRRRHRLDLDPAALVSDGSIKHINYEHIDGGGRHANARTNGLSLRELSVTGFRLITNASLTHLATAAPMLQRLDVRGTSVTLVAVERFRALRPDVEVITDGS